MQISRIGLILALVVGASGIFLNAMAAPSAADPLPRRAWLGTRFTLVSEPVAGGRVGRVNPGSPAESLGLKTGDVVTAINGKPIESGAWLAQYARRPAVGAVEFTVFRAGKSEQVRGTLPEYPRESYANADVIYDSVTDAKGERLRLTITRPRGQTGKLPAVFVAGWLSENPVESPPMFQDAISRIFRDLADSSGHVLYRVDKPGSGDSDGNASTGDFDTELAGYRAAFRAMERYNFIDRDRVTIFGISNGGGFAPLVAEGAPVRGYIVMGGWMKTWYEHMLEIERRRFVLMGKPPGEVSAAMKGVAELYTDYLVHGRMPADILQAKPQLASLWTDDTHAVQYGRPPSYYQQLQKLNLAEAWGKVAAPTLVMHGDMDWIMSRSDHEMIAEAVNRNAPGTAEFVALPFTGHGFQRFATMEKSFRFEEDPYDESHSQRIRDWLRRQK